MDMDMDMESPPAGLNTPDLPPIDNLPFPDIDMDGAADDVGSPAVEEPDPDLLRAIAPPPPLPTPEQIYERARYGILEEEEDENEAPGVAIPPGVDNFIVDWPFEDDMQIEDYELPPTVELEAEAELNAARMRKYLTCPQTYQLIALFFRSCRRYPGGFTGVDGPQDIQTSNGSEPRPQRIPEAPVYVR